MATVNEKMTAIADAIRDKTGETDALSLDDMAEAIPDVYEAGGKSTYDEFWDAYQNNGKRTIYGYRFAGNWPTSLFKPKYPIKLAANASSGVGMFFCFGNPDDVLDWRDVADMIDVSLTTDARNMFDSANINYIDVDLSNATNLTRCFGGGEQTSNPTHITVKVSEKCTTWTGVFAGRPTLTHLFFKEGSVIAANLSLSACNLLVYDSIMSIINALKDYSGTSTTRTLTLHATAKARLSDSDIAIATQKGWTIA